MRTTSQPKDERYERGCKRTDKRNRKDRDSTLLRLIIRVIFYLLLRVLGLIPCGRCVLWRERLLLLLKIELMLVLQQRRAIWSKRRRWFIQAGKVTSCTRRTRHPVLLSVSKLLAMKMLRVDECR